MLAPRCHDGAAWVGGFDYRSVVSSYLASVTGGIGRRLEALTQSLLRQAADRRLRVETSQHQAGGGRSQGVGWASMKACSFHLNTDVPENLRASSEDGRITRVPLNAENELFFTRVDDRDYCEGLRMVRFGARFSAGGRVTGLAYGMVFQVLPDWEPPNAEIFYDWCDSVSADVADLARWILDSKHYDSLFTTGDVLAVDAFEFRPEIDAAAQRLALREVATALRRRFRRLRRAVVVVHPHHRGEPPKIDGGSRRVKAYRRALAGVLEMARELHLTERLQPKTPTDDLLIGRDSSLDPDGELAELVLRTGILRRVLEEIPRGDPRSRLGPDAGSS